MSTDAKAVFDASIAQMNLQLPKIDRVIDMPTQEEVELAVLNDLPLRLRIIEVESFYSTPGFDPDELIKPDEEQMNIRFDGYWRITYLTLTDLADLTYETDGSYCFTGEFHYHDYSRVLGTTTEFDDSYRISVNAEKVATYRKLF